MVSKARLLNFCFVLALHSVHIFIGNFEHYFQYNHYAFLLALIPLDFSVLKIDVGKRAEKKAGRKIVFTQAVP